MNTDELARACDALTAREERPTVPEVLLLLNAYYEQPGCASGGSVHIITEDSNIDQSNADWCVGHAEEWGETWCRGGSGPHHLAIARLLQRCSRTQRGKLAVVHSYPRS